MIVNIHEAKTNLSKLIKAVENGEEVTIARDGKPVVKIVPALQARVPGGAEGRVVMMPDFFEMPDDFMDFFGGNKRDNS
jgi:prevent-host-death family protein